MTEVTEATEHKPDKFARRRVDEFAERRAELVTAALQTLCQLGIAKTSLRDIAQNSSSSHGVLHYYFTDKIEFIGYYVKQYRVERVKRYDALIATARCAEDLKRDFGAQMAATLRDDGVMHRLWYDLRNYSRFDDTFRNELFRNALNAYLAGDTRAADALEQDMRHLLDLVTKPATR